jgi:phage terminase small subunit
MPLPPRQAAFVREYLVDFNATQAAIRAGYAKKTAYSQGPRLLENVGIKRAIEKAQAKTAEKVELKAEDVVLLHKQGINIDPKKFEDEDGEPLPLSKIPFEVRRHICGVRTTKRWDKEAEEWVVTREYKWSPAFEHAREISKHLGLYAPEKHEVKLGLAEILSELENPEPKK